MIKNNILDIGFQILCVVYKLNEENIKVNFRILTENVKCDNYYDISKILNRLYDRMMIDGNWIVTEDDKWCFCYEISENFKPFVEGLFNITEDFDD
jgi:hypothetical protein